MFGLSIIRTNKLLALQAKVTRHDATWSQIEHMILDADRRAYDRCLKEHGWTYGIPITGMMPEAQRRLDIKTAIEDAGLGDYWK